MRVDDEFLVPEAGVAAPVEELVHPALHQAVVETPVFGEHPVVVGPRNHPVLAVDPQKGRALRALGKQRLTAGLDVAAGLVDVLPVGGPHLGQPDLLTRETVDLGLHEGGRRKAPAGAGEVLRGGRESARPGSRTQRARRAASMPDTSKRSSSFASSRALASSLTWARISSVLASAAARSSSLLRLHLLDHRVGSSFRRRSAGPSVAPAPRHSCGETQRQNCRRTQGGNRDCIAPSIDDVGTGVPKPDYTPFRKLSGVMAATRAATAASQCFGGGAVTARRTCEVPPKSSPGHRPTP